MPLGSTRANVHGAWARILTSFASPAWAGKTDVERRTSRDVMVRYTLSCWHLAFGETKRTRNASGTDSTILRRMCPAVPRRMKHYVSRLHHMLEDWGILLGLVGLVTEAMVF